MAYGEVNPQDWGINVAPYTGDEQFAPWDPYEFGRRFRQYTTRWAERDDRTRLVADVVAGRWGVLDADDRPLPVYSPNIIQAGLEDTASAAAMLPTIRVDASKPDQDLAERRAAKMEQIGASYVARMGGKLAYKSSSLALGGAGYSAWQCVMTDEGAVPQWRDPRCVYPEPDVSTLGAAKRAFVARDMYVTQLPDQCQAAWRDWCDMQGWDYGYFYDRAVTLVEYSDPDRVTTALGCNPTTVPSLDDSYRYTTPITWVSVIVEDEPNEIGMCRTVYGQIPTFDGEPRGQYDQVIGVQQGHIKLTSMAIEHAGQAVYNELVVIDPLSSDIPTGPDAVIELGPNGKAFRLPPATVSFSFFEETNRLLDAVHVGSRWPRARTGEVRQSQASSKFVESTVSIQNAVISDHHSVLQEMTTQAANVCFALDYTYGPERTIAGVLRSQRYRLEMKRSDIDLEARVAAEYGIGFGQDVAQSAVMAIQLHSAGFIAREDAQENTPGITDVARTRSRILGESLEDMLMGGLALSTQQGALPPEQLIEMIRLVRKGATLVDVYEQVVLAARQQQLSTMGGQRLTPGEGPQQGAMPPPGPDPAAVMAELFGAQPDTRTQLSAPVGDYSFATTGT